MAEGSIAVVGLGNAWAGDDAAGLLVARSLSGRVDGSVRVLELEGEPAALVQEWTGLEAAIVVDAVRGAGPPGSIHRWDASSEPLPTTVATPSTHAFGLAATIELSRALGRLPARLVVIGVEGSSFGAGAGPSAEVADAVEPAARAVLAEVGSAARLSDPPAPRPAPR